MTEFSQSYNNNHNSKYQIEKLHINTQTNEENGINTILVTWTQLPDVTIFNCQLNFIFVINIEEERSYYAIRMQLIIEFLHKYSR